MPEYTGGRKLAEAALSNDFDVFDQNLKIVFRGRQPVILQTPEIKLDSFLNVGICLIKGISLKVSPWEAHPGSAGTLAE